MVIEAERDPGSSTSASVTVIAVDETLSAAEDVAGVVESASGTVVRRLGGLGDYAAVSIRGSSFRQVQVYLDGVPLNPDGSSAVNLSELPLSALSRVEIYRGSAPPRFGAAPIGGVLNLVTADAPARPAAALSIGQHHTARLNLSGGSTGTLADRPVDALVLAEMFSTRGDYTWFSDNGTLYNLTDDRLPSRENNDKTQLSVVSRARWGGLTLQDAFLSRETGLPGHSGSPTTSARLQTTRNLITLQAEGGDGVRHGSARLWHQLRWEDFTDLDGEIGTGTQDERLAAGTTGLLMSGATALSEQSVPAATLSARRESATITDHLLGTASEPRHRLAGTAALSADFWWADARIHLSPVLQGALIDDRALGDIDAATIHAAFTPRIGLLLRPRDGIALKANAGRFFPDLTELFGDQGAISGNDDLIAEKGLQWDVGGRLVWDGAVPGSLDVTHFWNDIDDRIIYIQNSQRTVMPTNFGRAWTQGLETALTLDALGVLDSQSNLTWTLSRNLTEGSSAVNNQLPRVPEWEVYQGTSIHHDQRIRLGHTFSYTAGNYWDATNWFRSAPRAVHGAFLRLSAGALSAEGSLLNLTDTIATPVDRNPLSDDDDARVLQPITDFIGYPLPGRTWMLTLRWSGAPKGSTP